MVNHNWIKTYVIQILPILSLIVYIIGFAYNMFYYSQFGIKITSYISLSEVFVLTLVPIFIALALSASLFVAQALLRYPNKDFLRNCKSLKKRFGKTVIAKKITKISQYIRRKLRLKGKDIKGIDRRSDTQIQYLLTFPLSFVFIFVIIPFNIYIGTMDAQYKKLWIISLMALAFLVLGVISNIIEKYDFKL